MANITASDVIIRESWTTGDVTGKRNKVLRVEWVSGTGGGIVNLFPVSALGLTKAYNLTSMYNGDGLNVILATLNGDGTLIYVQLISGGSLTIGDHSPSPSPIGTYFTIEGY